MKHRITTWFVSSAICVTAGSQTFAQGGAVNHGPGALVWTSSAYTASNANGGAPASDIAQTNNSAINFSVMNDPTTGNYVNGAPFVSTIDFSAGGLLIDHDDGSTGVISTTMLTPNAALSGVSFTIGDLDSNNAAGKLDGVIVSALDETGATIFPSITAGSQLNVTGNPGEVVSTIGPNNGQDNPASQALFTFGAATFVSKINIDFANYGNITDDQHMSISNINWRATVPEPTSGLLLASFVVLGCLKRRR